MEEVDKGCLMIRTGASGWVFLLVPAYPGSPGHRAINQLCVCVCLSYDEKLSCCIVGTQFTLGMMIDRCGLSVCQGCTGDEREMAKQIASVSPRSVSLSVCVTITVSLILTCVFLCCQEDMWLIYTMVPSVLYAFSALTLLVGRQKEHPTCKNWMMRCWYGYLSAERCRLFAYGPADATAVPKPHHLLPRFNPDCFYLSGTCLPCCPGKEAVKRL